jgi:hypothetical protein
MNLLSREVLRGGEKVDLQAREFALLEYLPLASATLFGLSKILLPCWIK